MYLGSIFGPILSNIIFNDFFFFIPKGFVHNFADDNTLCSFAKTLRGLVTILQSECETEINWLHNNKMIVNPDKIQVILLDKGRSDNTNIEIEIGNEKISSTSSVKLLGVRIHKPVKWKPVKCTDTTKIVLRCKWKCYYK